LRIELRATDEHSGVRLDAALARHPDVSSRAAAQRLIDANRVTVNGRARPKNWRLATGDLVEAGLGDPDPGAAEPVPYAILFEDEHLMVVDKPAGVVTHPARGHRGTTLAEALAERGAAGGPEPERPGIVHRLDRDTSGLLIVARSEPAHAALRRMIAAREVLREYLALVSGVPDTDEGTIDAPLGRDRRRRTVVSTRTDRPRPAVTHFTVLERLPRTALLRVRLETGRTHQIRAHLAAIGHPVCGDRAYRGTDCGRRLGLKRQYLHSARLMFRHPFTGEQVACESKPPVDLRRAFDVAKREPVSGGPDGD
jgi:23S rRNA pseudouridine1911/1915/1917 synthase